jgi:Cu2+-exporting ATPase
MKCRHCGLGFRGVGEFCCHGCATAFTLLESCGLGGHAALREQAVAAGAQPQPVPAVGPTESGWATPEFLARVATDMGKGRFAMSWAVEDMHCPACTWVLERLPFIDAGIEHATVDLGRGILRTVHRAADTDLQRIASVAATLGYRLRPWAGAGEDERRRAVARGLALRAAVALACAVGAMQLAMNLAAGELTGDLAPQLRQMFALGALLLALPALAALCSNRQARALPQEICLTAQLGAQATYLH